MADDDDKIPQTATSALKANPFLESLAPEEEKQHYQDAIQKLNEALDERLRLQKSAPFFAAAKGFGLSGPSGAQGAAGAAGAYGEAQQSAAAEASRIAAMRMELAQQGMARAGAAPLAKMYMGAAANSLGLPPPAGMPGGPAPNAAPGAPSPGAMPVGGAQSASPMGLNPPPPQGPPGGGMQPTAGAAPGGQAVPTNVPPTPPGVPSPAMLALGALAGAPGNSEMIRIAAQHQPKVSIREGFMYDETSGTILASVPYADNQGNIHISQYENGRWVVHPVEGALQEQVANTLAKALPGLLTETVDTTYPTDFPDKSRAGRTIRTNKLDSLAVSSPASYKAVMQILQQGGQGGAQAQPVASPAQPPAQPQPVAGQAAVPPTASATPPTMAPGVAPATGGVVVAGTPDKQAQEGLNTEGIGLQKKLNSDVQDANQVAQLLSQAHEAAEGFRSGKLAPLQQLIYAMRDGFGLQMTPEEEKKVSSMQDLDKVTVQLAAKWTRAVSSRPAVFEFMKLLTAVPNKDLTTEGLSRIFNHLEEQTMLPKQELDFFNKFTAGKPPWQWPQYMGPWSDQLWQHYQPKTLKDATLQDPKIAELNRRYQAHELSKEQWQAAASEQMPRIRHHWDEMHRQ